HPFTPVYTMSATPAPRPHGSTPCPPKTTSRPPCGHDRRADPPRPRPAHLSGEQRGLDRPPARGVPLDAVQARARTVGRPDRDPGAVATDGGLLVLLSNLQERSEEHTSELQSRFDLVCRLLLAKKNKRS